MSRCTNAPEPIAIIGIGCAFPGARGPKAFWQLLREGRSAIREIPPERFGIDHYHDPTPGLPGKIITRWGGFLENVKGFDPGFFGISMREAESMDPQQRLLLEVAWEAVEDAGVTRAELSNATTGVFIGVSSSDYSDMQLQQQDSTSLDVYTLPGTARSIVAGRLSHLFDLMGPSIAVDTACSSSLVAAHLACQSLWTGECNMALVGGVNVILTPEAWSVLSLAHILSPDGCPRVFDARANGFVRGEGAGMALLKPLSQAEADGDPIYAVIRGSAINNDGHNSSVMTPNPRAQAAVLRAAYQHAGITPGQIHYIETHGTGTSVGDPVEAQALGTVMAGERSLDAPCLIGSVKTNIGHLEAGAGIAGFIKTALCLKYRAIPPSLHFEIPNPAVPWEKLPLLVQQSYDEWPVMEGTAWAGVSSFGISGTNVHMVLADRSPAPVTHGRPVPASPFILPLSAHTSAALAETVAKFHEFLNNGDGFDVKENGRRATHNAIEFLEHRTSNHPVSEEEHYFLQDLCYSASVRRTHHPQRLAFVFQTQQQLSEQLDTYCTSTPVAQPSTVVHGNYNGPVFVFSGQGAKFWPFDATLLTQLPILREVLTRCEENLYRQGADWSLLEQLTETTEFSRLHETDVCQAAIFACQAALAALWQSWGIVPSAVIGHSLGEVAAAHVAGALSLEEAISIVFERGRITKRAAGKGCMALVGLSTAAATDAIQGYSSALTVAVSNSPTTSVLSGEPTALAEVVERLKKDNIFVRRLPAIDYAAHSPQMELLKHELAQTLQGLTPQPTTVPFYSTVTTTALDGTALNAQYWADNLREPVHFSCTVQHVLSAGHRCLLEVHPTQVLLRPMQEIIDHTGADATVYTSLHRNSDGPIGLLRTLANLYSDGHLVCWEGVYPNDGRHVSLPTTAWQRVPCWLSGSQTQRARHSAAASIAPHHPLVGIPIQSATQPSTYLAQTELGSNNPTYLADHRIFNAIVFPAAAFVEMAFAVAAAIRPAEQFTLVELQLERSLTWSDSKTIPIQIAVTATGEMLSLNYYSYHDAIDESTWVHHAKATVQSTQSDLYKTPVQLSIKPSEPVVFQLAATAKLSGDELYPVMASHGLQYGPHFQGIEQLWLREAEAMAKLNPPQSVLTEASKYHLHPVLLDLAFQSVAALLQSVASIPITELYLPVALKTLKIHHPPQQAIYTHAVLHPPQDGTQQFMADVSLLDSKGAVLVEAQGLVLQQVTKMSAMAKQDPDQHFYQVTWQQESLPALSEPAAPGRWLIIGNPSGTGQALAEQLQRADQECLLLPAMDIHKARTALENDGLLCHLQSALAQRDKPISGLVYLAMLETTVDEAMTAPTEKGPLLGLLYLSQLLAQHSESHGEVKPAPRLWVVTHAAQSVTEVDSTILNQTPLWGLVRTINLESPKLRCSSVDLQVEPAREEIALLCQEIVSDGPETQIAYRRNLRFVARVTRYRAKCTRHSRSTVPGESIRLETVAQGILDNLHWAATTKIAPTSNQVEIRVHSAGLNFLDVLSALGMRPDQQDAEPSLGMECAGTVTRVGDNVTNVQVGDAVLAVAPHSIASYVCTDAALVQPKPELLSFQEAATVPIAYLTAYYALHTLGRLRAGERVLIHAATGGVGLAAVYLAQHCGAEIYATAGSDEKRALLRNLGVPYVMNSRSLHFADEVMEYTDGEGVDLVLNSLAGEAIPRSLALLRTNGRFLEIGKRDIYGHSNLDMGLLKNNIAFFAIDLLPLMAEQPAFCAEMLAELVVLLTSNVLPPLPHTEFPSTEAEEAFRYMAQAKQIGKIVIRVDNANAAPLQITSQTYRSIRNDGTYLITGGLGGLGLAVARWLVTQGAQNLMLLSRHEPVPAVAESVATLQAAGANIVTMQADVTCESQLKLVLEQIETTMPPLRGIFHAAGVLDDGLLLDLNPSRFARVMAPKVDGGWLLHQLTNHLDLDLFVLFSSATAILGSPGQGNYVAANAFLDGLARYRQQQGLPALSINWGAWSEVGMATQTHRAANLAQHGIRPFTPAQGIQQLERLLATSAVQVAAVDIDWERITQHGTPPILENLIAELNALDDAPSAGANALRQQLQCLAPSDRQRTVATLLQEQLAQVLRTPAHDLGLRQPLSELGIDSLMTIEVVNRIDARWGLTLPMATLLENPTIFDLADRICALLEPTSPLAARQSSDADEADNVADEHFACTVTTLADEGRLDPPIQIPPVVTPSQSMERQIFLTGATGFVGSFMLRELLQKTTAQIHCLVRATDKTEGHRRIAETLRCICPVDKSALERITVIRGDLAQPQLGLAATDFDRLGEQIDLIIHGGAQIQWLATYAQLKASNVGGTEAILRLAAHQRPKPLHYLSSLAIFPMMQQEISPTFDEEHPLDHTGVLYGGYAQSKWVAEKLVTNAQEYGLQTMIYRPSLVVGHSQSGIWQGNNIIVNMLRSWIELGMAPDLDAHLDLVPVDYVSRAIVQLALDNSGSPNHVFHLNNPLTVSVRDLIDWLAASGYAVRCIPYQEWRAEMLKRGERQRQAVLDAVGPLLALQVSTEIGWLERLPRFDNQRTRQALNGLSCPTINASTFQKYVGYLQEQGTFPSDL